MWGWLSGIVDKLTTVKEGIESIPQLIVNGIGAFIEDIIEYIIDIKDNILDTKDSIIENILSLPELILDGIKSIFIPDSEYIEDSFNSFLDEMKRKFNIDTGAFENLFSTSTPVSDTYTNYSLHGVGTFRLKIFDSSYFVDGVTYFRPYIRGFLVLMMLLYHVKQAIGFFGYDAGVVTGRTEHIKSARRDQ